MSHTKQNVQQERLSVRETLSRMNCIEDVVDIAYPILSADKVYWPQQKLKEFLSRSIQCYKNKEYSISNGVIAFIYHEKLWLCPYMEKVIMILDKSGYNNSSNYVPLSTGEYLLNRSTDYWNRLKQYVEDFSKETEA